METALFFTVLPLLPMLGAIVAFLLLGLYYEVTGRWPQ